MRLCLTDIYRRDIIRDQTKPRSKDLEEDASVLASILQIFKKGTLIVDEVDLVLQCAL